MTGKMGKPLTCFNLFSRSSIFDNLKALKVCEINSCRFLVVVSAKSWITYQEDDMN